MAIRSFASQHDNALQSLNMGVAKEHDVPAVFDLAYQLISDQVAPLDKMQSVHRHHPGSFLVVRDQTTPIPVCSGEGQSAEGTDAATSEIRTHAQDSNITGFFALLPFTPEGERALWSDYFSGRDLNLDWIATENDTPSALYVWGMAGSSAFARRALWKVTKYVETQMYPGIPYYATAGTAIGERILKGVGFRPMRTMTPSAPEHLYGRFSHIHLTAAAA